MLGLDLLLGRFGSSFQWWTVTRFNKPPVRDHEVSLASMRLRECLTLLRWSQRGLADALECDRRLVRHWASGDRAIPDNVAAWLEDLATVTAARPPSGAWQRWVA